MRSVEVVQRPASLLARGQVMRSITRILVVPVCIWGLVGMRAAAEDAVAFNKDIRPLLILHSDNDQSVPIDNALLMVDALRKAGAPFQFQRYPKMGHMGINDEVAKQAFAFIKKHSEQKEPGVDSPR